MAIYKKIDGKDQIVANKSIVSHEQLSGREAYGAHPISAIRKLPEKLHALKEKDDELSNRITAHDEEVDREVARIDQEAKDLRDDLNTEIQNRVDEIQRVEDNANQIKLIEDQENKGKLLFTDYNGDETSVQGGFLPDEDTLSLNENNEMILKKVHTDTDTIIGDGITSNKISAIAIKDEDGVITPKNIRDKHTLIDQTISNLTQNTEQELEAIKKLNKEQVDQISDLLTRTQGMGGYLNAYNFGKNVTQDALTNYAIQDIGSITEGVEIYNGTKVKNLYNGDIWILTNTPSWTDNEGTVHNAVFSWENQGNDNVISDANNDGVHGLVTGSYEHLEGFVDNAGHISINGLEEELDNRVHKIEYSKDQTFPDGSDGGVIGRAYIRFRDNTENSIVLNCQNTKYTIPVRDSAGNFYVGTPTQLWHTTNKKYVDEADTSLDTKKLDKVDNTGKATQVYASGNNGQEMIGVANTPGVYTVPRYDTNKNIKSNEPVDDLDVTNKAYVKSQDDLKVDKVSTAYQIYGTDYQGEQKTYRINTANEATVNAIPFRGTNGALYIPDASIEDSGNVIEGQQAVNKSYVNTTITNALIHGDNTTIIENVDQTFTAVGLYDTINNIYKTAENIIKGTTLVILGEDE